MILLGVHELLSTIRQGFCSNHGSLNFIDKEGRGVAMGALSMTCLSAIEGIIMRCASLVVPKP